jgi:hypothetical protein
VPTVDLRTVGEPLADSDALSRELLLDASPSHGRAMVRAWGRLVQSAAQLWAVLPPTSLAGPSGPDLMVRLHGLGEGIARSAGHWPGPGRQDQRPAEIVRNLSRARELIARYGPDVQPTVSRRGPTLPLPAPALYVGAHATAVALREYAKDLRGRPTRGDPKAPAHRIAAGRSRNPRG